jgi:uncharacterized protein
MAAVPELTIASSYPISGGAEVDLVLEILGHGLWAVDIKRGLSARPERGFYNACEDLKPNRRFVVNFGFAPLFNVSSRDAKKEYRIN